MSTERDVSFLNFHTRQKQIAEFKTRHIQRQGKQKRRTVRPITGLDSLVKPTTQDRPGNKLRYLVYLSQYLTNLMHKICFTISFISCLYMFRAHVLIIRRSKFYYTACGIITLKQVSGLKLLKYNSINMSK